MKIQMCDTQNVIRNKFQKACMNRIDHENKQNQAMEPLHIESSNNEKSSTTTTLIAKQVDCVNEEKEPDDPNELCNRLRLLINSQIADNVNHMHEINSIVAKLAELEILV